MRTLLRFEKRHPSPPVAEVEYEEKSLGRIYLHFAIAATFLIAAGVWLATIGDEIAGVTGLGRSFVGSLFLGFSTSLPEITVSFTAMRMGAIDLAIANMIGSNLFNMTIIPIDDLLYTKGPVLAAVSESNLIIGSVVILMTLIFIAGLHFKPKRYFRLSWCNCILVILFFLGAYLNFTLA